MSDRFIKTKILQRIDSELNWTQSNPMLSSGEMVFSRTSLGTFMKVGDGRTYLDTPFFNDIRIDENQISNLNFVHVSRDEYKEMVVTSSINENTIYFLSGDTCDVYGKRIENLHDAVDISDAVNLGQMSAFVGEQVKSEVSNFISAEQDPILKQISSSFALESMLNDGLSTISTILSSKADISAVPHVSVDGELGDIGFMHVSREEYEQILEDGPLSNTLYLVSAEFNDAYGMQIKNLSDATDLSDAVTLNQLSSTAQTVSSDLVQYVNNTLGDIETLLNNL